MSDFDYETQFHDQLVVVGSFFGCARRETEVVVEVAGIVVGWPEHAAGVAIRFEHQNECLLREVGILGKTVDALAGWEIRHGAEVATVMFAGLIAEQVAFGIRLDDVVEYLD